MWLMVLRGHSSRRRTRLRRLLHRLAASHRAKMLVLIFSCTGARELRTALGLLFAAFWFPFCCVTAEEANFFDTDSITGPAAALCT